MKRFQRHLQHVQRSFTWSDVEEDVRMIALSKGICARTVPYDEQKSVYPLPVTLFPTPFDRNCFHIANNLQCYFNELIYRISGDYMILGEYLRCMPDEFVKELLNIYLTVYREGYASKSQLGIFRMDYMVDNFQMLKQIEMNTISVSFPALSTKVTELHRYTMEHYTGLNPDTFFLPDNNSLKAVAQTLMDAHSFYSKPDAAILFVIKEDETNVMDQKLLEWEIEIHRIKVFRRTFKELDNNIELGPNRELLLTIGQNELLIKRQFEISVVYFRTGYTTSNYLYKNSWSLRLLLERSRAIKCPSIQFQLAGLKIYQKVFVQQKIFDRYVRKPDGLPLYELFTEFWDINNESKALVEHNPFNYVLKSNQEGGGNNFFGLDIIRQMDEIIEKDQQDAYFLMEFVKTVPYKNFVIHKGTSGEFQYETLESELGVYGSIFTNDGNLVFNRNSGHLLRSKFKGNNEAGITSSGGILDSPFLINTFPLSS